MTEEEIKSNISIALYELSRFRTHYDHGKTSWHNRTLDGIENLLKPCIDPTESPSETAAVTGLYSPIHTPQGD
jgi:hypothetical protein